MPDLRIAMVVLMLLSAGCARHAGLAAVDTPETATTPAPLLARGVVDSAAREQQVCALIGRQACELLAETAALATESETPGLTTYNVRGLSTVMEAAVQQEGGVFRIGLIDGDEVHYWSSDAASQADPPAWFDTWRARFADKPVRLMSLPGTPLHAGRAHGP